MDIEFPETPPQNPDDESPFGPVIHSYTRKQAIADGFQIDVTDVAKEAGLRFPVFITRSVYESCVAVPKGVDAQDESGRLWDVLWMTRFAISKAAADARTVSVELYVRNDNRRSRLTRLVATCGALDIDDPQPAITIMIPGED